MGLKYLYDTNVFSDYFSDRLEDLDLFNEKFIIENEVLISPVVRMELLSHPDITDDEDKLFTELLDNFESVEIDFEVEKETILLRRKYKLKLPDAIIAASAIIEDAVLVTNDKKDFSKVSELKIY
ncbi:MAG: type II toxin-antitoxin system VapC family toxin [Ignavibacteria bacterium]|nr:type II toxin-antitoxin system VapC family toxin [Ignavibacteria bacterium]